jgi:hypothetical protein
MKYRVVTHSRPSGLTDKINDMVEEGWELEKTSFNAVERHHQLRYSGNQHKDTQIESEYSVLMFKSE